MTLTNLFLLFSVLYFMTICTVNHAFGQDSASFYVCQMEAGDIGKLKYRSDNMEEAMIKVVGECTERRTNMYLRDRGYESSEERQTEFVLSCTNSTSCVKHEFPTVNKRDKNDYEF